MTDRGIKLFGTDEAVPERRVLTAGPVTATLENGQLRWIRIGEAEAIRSISFTVRDRNWSTPVPEITHLKIDESGGGFKVQVDALCRTLDGNLAWHAEYTGAPDGTIRCVGTAKTDKDFLTCRTGFVILHPLSGVVGNLMKIEHVDGSTEQATIPEQILSDQPFLLVRAMTHEPMPGVTAQIRMEGDSWETEDHRNWTDASFKTYCRPLVLPYPYTIPAGGEVKHTATLTFSRPAADGTGEIRRRRDGQARRGNRADAADRPQRPAGRRGTRIVGRRSGQAGGAAASELPDRSAGAGVGRRRSRSMAIWSRRPARRRLLEVIIPGTGAPDAELQPVAACRCESRVETGRDRRDASRRLEILSAGHARFRTTCPVLDRHRHRGAPEFSGRPDRWRHAVANFTEFNRKQPPKGVFDFITHATSALVHAADDRSVMETLDSIGHIIRATKGIIGGGAYRIGPSHIGNSFNPYGANYTENPENRRVTMARVEPRHRGLFGAAWHLGYISQAAHGGVEAATLASPIGEFGIAYAKLAHAQPGLDGAADARVYPVFHVIRGLSAAAGLPHLEAKSGDTERLRCVAWRKGKMLYLWLANLRDEVLEVNLEGFPRNGTLGSLDEQSFAAAIKDTAFGEKTAAFSGTSVKLPPLAIAWLTFDA